MSPAARRRLNEPKSELLQAGPVRDRRDRRILVLVIIGTGASRRSASRSVPYFNESVQGLDIRAPRWCTTAASTWPGSTRITFTYVGHEHDRPMGDRSATCAGRSTVEAETRSARASDIGSPEATARARCAGAAHSLAPCRHFRHRAT